MAAAARIGVVGLLLLAAVRMGNEKAIRNAPDSPLELFDLARDMAEKTNVAKDNPAIVAKIEAYLKTARTDPPPQLEPDKPPGKLFR
jgi:arylsulfatase A-like enzyme